MLKKIKLDSSLWQLWVSYNHSSKSVYRFIKSHNMLSDSMQSFEGFSKHLDTCYACTYFNYNDKQVLIDLPNDPSIHFGQLIGLAAHESLHFVIESYKGTIKAHMNPGKEELFVRAYESVFGKVLNVLIQELE